MSREQVTTVKERKAIAQESFQQGYEKARKDFQKVVNALQTILDKLQAQQEPKKRGRPRKTATTVKKTSTRKVAVKKTTQKRGPGRPRKSDTAVKPVAKRGRGRPRKSEMVS